MKECVFFSSLTSQHSVPSLDAEIRDGMSVLLYNYSMPEFQY